MQSELNYIWIQELLEKAKLKVSNGLLSQEFTHYIHDVFHNKLESKEGKEPKWNLDEFLTLCVIFYIEEILSKLEIQENKEEKYHVRKYRNTYILNLKPSKNLNKYKNSDCNLKIEGVESYYQANQRLLKSLLKHKSINHSLTPFQWIRLVSISFFCDSTKQFLNPKKSLIVSSTIKRLIYYHHYKLDDRKARRGIFPIEIFSLEEALNFLEISDDNLLGRCFLDNIGVYCKTSSYKIKDTCDPDFFPNPLWSYVYYFEGLERLHKSISTYDVSRSRLHSTDSPVKQLWKSGAIYVKPGEAYLPIPLQPSLAEICLGITEKNIILDYGQQITRKALFLSNQILKS